MKATASQATSPQTGNDTANPVKSVFAVIMGGGSVVVHKHEAPLYSKAHTEEYVNFGSSKIRKEKVPDRIALVNHQFDVNAIGDAKPFPTGTKAVKFTMEDSAAYRALKSEIEATKASLDAKMKAFLAEAAGRAGKINREDCGNFPKTLA